MLKSTTYPCSKCGSTHTVVRNTPPGKGLIGKLISEIAEISSIFQPRVPLAGTQYIVCKDCGHVGMMIF